MQETQVINQLLWLPLIFLSGATFPLAFLPHVVQKVLVVPSGYLSRPGFASARYSIPRTFGGSAFKSALSLFGASSHFSSPLSFFRWEPEVKVPRRAKLLVVATAIPFLLLGLWENKYGNIPAQAQSAFDSLTRTREVRPSSRFAEELRPDSPK